MRAKDHAASRPSFAFSALAAVVLNVVSIMTVTAMTSGWQSPAAGGSAATRVSWITTTAPRASVAAVPPSTPPPVSVARPQPKAVLAAAPAQSPVAPLPPSTASAANEANDDTGAIRFYRSAEVEQRAEPESDWNLDIALLDVMGIDTLVFDVFTDRSGRVVDCTIVLPDTLLAEARATIEQRLRDTIVKPAMRAGTAVATVQRIEITVAPSVW
jgi:hypothetical protein